MVSVLVPILSTSLFVSLASPTATSPMQPAQGTVTSAFACASYVKDGAVQGNCLAASSVPTLGALYPMSPYWNVDAIGNVGLGTTAPQTALHVFGTAPVLSLTDSDQFADTNDRIQIRTQNENVLFQFFDSSAATTKTLVSIAQGGVLTAGTGVARAQINGDNAQMDLRSSGGVTGISLRGNGTNDIRVMDATGATSIQLVGTTGRTTTKSLQITGGADVVERFPSTEREALEPGTLVVLDATHPGAVVSSSAAYDKKVIGVVSGAGGVRPGIELTQTEVLDGDVQVAMVGRVYVKCSAENGAIEPGDRLTTASLIGHAMKATDRDLADGAVIGKAASALAEGTGLVLVVVNLQ